MLLSAAGWLWRPLEYFAATQKCGNNRAGIGNAKIKNQRRQRADGQEISPEAAPLQLEVGWQRHADNDGKEKNKNCREDRSHGRHSSAPKYDIEKQRRCGECDDGQRALIEDEKARLNLP